MADAIAKLLKKLSKEERVALLELLREIQSDNIQNLDVKKLRGGKYFRVRKGDFRIVYHREGDLVHIDAVRKRNENTYCDF